MLISIVPQRDALLEQVVREISVVNVDALMAIDRMNRSALPLRDKQAFAARRTAKYEADIVSRLQLVAAFCGQRVEIQAPKRDAD
jgi:hypothetical protein